MKYFFFFFLIFTFSFGFLREVGATESIKELTYYSDAFEGSRTSNGDIFSQNGFSAAICDIPLGRYIYAKSNNTGIVLHTNDRPNCNRYPDILDVSRRAFAVFGPTSIGRIDGVEVTDMGVAPTKHVKSFLPSTIFSHLSVILTEDVPNIFYRGQGVVLRGKVTLDRDTVIIAISNTEKGYNDAQLFPVSKDGSFEAYITLPKEVGDYTCIIAAGNGFNTTEYATISVIDGNTLRYPFLPIQKLSLSPRIISAHKLGIPPVIPLPSGIYGLLEIQQGSTSYTSEGTALILSPKNLKPGRASVKIDGYKTSTPSGLDRTNEYTTLYSGSVLLDRTHDTIGRKNVQIRTIRNIANIRFKTPHDIRIRPKYYLTLSSGKVKELVFDSTLIAEDRYLKPSTLVNLRVALPEEGGYMFEIVQKDGLAFVNIPLTRGAIWSILPPLSDSEIRTISNNSNQVRIDTANRINELRTTLGENRVISDESLTRLAQAKVDDMVTRKYMGHADPDGKYINTLADKIGVDFGTTIGENIGYGSASHLALQDGLEESGVHKSNMLDPTWTRVGIGYGVNGKEVYLVHVFGK